mmetsp:Transcript_19997/g.41629  ORF Transcript_19997/g.41629 Transcript_19997/m.41629 type:complete len:144 (+) Transcript_19997:319-750(+)
MGDVARDRMMGEIASAGDCSAGDASGKSILIRGCDPVMAERAGKMLPPMLGNVKMTSATSDDVFLKLLETEKFHVVTFAPGACRYDAAKQPIPGGNDTTAGWTLEQYRALVREKQGEAIAIVESTEERQMVPLLRAALGLPPA